MLCIQLDICVIVGMVSRYHSNIRKVHWHAINNTLKYLKRTRDFILTYNIEDLILVGYTDSDFQADKDECKYTRGYAFTLSGGDIS